jgi:uncharacterized protein YkwD
MRTTPCRPSGLVALALALVAVGAVGAAPAQARTTTPHRMPHTASVRSSAAAVTPLGDATAGAGAVRGRSYLPVRRSTPTADPAVTEVVRLVNAARSDAGCSPLRVDSRLATAARLHSEDMAQRNYFSHTSLDGRSPWDRMTAQGYTDGSGENIAAGYSTPASVMAGWMNSPGHRANILNCSSTAIGVGVGRNSASTYGTYWTQDFGRR